ncbi:hypothetical protein DL240_11000 [Lujinxingia litoralis]|uniref:DUF7282 domain-containing protein n=1 Tax=Lujinxingia litoralis TaxID=2211119 RepID=A0A328C543_9DELT|nr:hypothetical protein [Lujinxingia litoralis]RAL22369.1 hypothetical protein DL240_11000 [Lujinxingia litoralis]
MFTTALVACGYDEIPLFNEPENLLIIEDQSPPLATEIQISRVIAESAGFITIHDADADGTPANLLGTLPVDAGSATDLTVELTRHLVDQELLLGSLYLSDSDPESFEPDDHQVATSQGEPLQVAFTVSLEAIAITPALDVENQMVDPPYEVLISQVATTEPAWLVIRTDNEGQPGDVIGSALLARGIYQNMRVALHRDAFDQERLHASLHIDARADDAFDPASDLPVAINNTPLERAFTVALPERDPAATLTVQDQSVDLNNASRIVIASAELIGTAGWLVIYNDNGGRPGTVLASKLLDAGVHQNVAFELNEALTDDTTLYARIHQENPADGNFTYDGQNGEDPVVMVDQKPVVARFSVTPIDPNTPAIIVRDQILESRPLNQIHIDAVVYNQPGHLVVFDHNDAFLGTLELGAEPAIKSNLTLTLSRDIEGIESLRARLYTDTTAGDAFDRDQDPQVTDANGAPVEASFTVDLLTMALETRDLLLDQVSTEVRIDLVHARQDLTLEIVAEDDDTKLLAEASLDYGIHEDIALTLDRPLLDGERLVAQLFIQNNEGVRVPARDPSGAPLRATFEVSVPPGTPAIFLTLSTSGSNYRVTRVLPAGYAHIIDGGYQASDPTLTLYKGWRYGINNTVFADNPLEFGKRVAISFTSLLSQRGDGAYDGDSRVNRRVDGQRIWFTLSDDLVNAGLNRYRSATVGFGIGRRGDLRISDAPGLRQR